MPPPARGTTPPGRSSRRGSSRRGRGATRPRPRSLGLARARSRPRSRARPGGPSGPEAVLEALPGLVPLAEEALETLVPAVDAPAPAHDPEVLLWAAGRVQSGERMQAVGSLL